MPIDVDPKHPERRNFGSLTLLSAFQIESKDKRFGGLSGLAIGADGKLYGVSDHGYWLSAKMAMDPNGVLLGTYENRIVRGRGDEYNELYLGANYYFYGHKLKLQSGLQFADMNDRAADGGDYSGVSWTTGIRVGW